MSQQTTKTQQDDPTTSEENSIDFCTLGMFIIDDIYPPPSAPSQSPSLNIIGGAGTYSAIGARLFSPGPISKSVGWIIDAGTDFPPDLLETINSWQTSAVIRPRDGPTTRGWNGYAENDHRSFKYLTEKKRITAQDLIPYPHLLESRSFHLICGPERAVEQVQGILSHLPSFSSSQNRDGRGTGRPLFIWEPVPDLCLPSSLPATLEALRCIDIISPNHEELASLFGTPSAHSEKLDRALVESQARSLLESGIGPFGKGSVIVRCGAKGCYILSPSIRAWLPAYHTKAAKVIDPTGGGNGFLGGLAVGMVRTGGDVLEAARWGSVSASFCIEQVGMPVLTMTTGEGDAEDEGRGGGGGGEGGGEKWNGVDVFERLEEFRGRCAEGGR